MELMFVPRLDGILGVGNEKPKIPDGVSARNGLFLLANDVIAARDGPKSETRVQCLFVIQCVRADSAPDQMCVSVNVGITEICVRKAALIQKKNFRDVS